MLIEPNEHYISVISHSLNCFNNPKYWLNQALESMYRHHGYAGVEDYLKHYRFTNLDKLTKQFCDWRSKLTHQQAYSIILKEQWKFEKITEYPEYLQKIFKEMDKMDNQILSEEWNCGTLISRKYNRYNYTVM